MKPSLALIMGKGAPKGPPMPDDKAAPPSPDDEATEGSGDEAAYAKLVVDALKDGDEAGAADALVELVRACK